MSIVVGQENDTAPSSGLTRGGLGFLGGLVLCGVALLTQAAVLHAIAGSGKKTS